VKALGANNEDLKGRRIAVTIADSRVRSQKKEPDSGMGKKADARSRSLRILELPTTTHDVSTLEGLLEQAFEKHATVKRVEVFAEKNEAVLEFETAAVSKS
jgi:squamous cell carcinoma antigen recognized by T-cells 3